jgi:signal peptidase I
MNKFYQLIFLGLFFFVSSISTPAQSYKWAKEINTNDSGQITAQAISKNGELYIASLRSEAGRLGDFGLNGTFKKGLMILSKFNSDGGLIWSKTFKNSNGRIFKMQTDKKGDLIVAGGFYDSLIFTNKAKHYSAPFLSQSFISKFDTSGQHIWSKSSTPGNTNYVSFTFAILDTTIIESGMFSGIYPALRKLNTNGDTIATLGLGSKFRIISDIAIDENEDIYITGGAFSNAMIDTVTIPKPDNTSGYLNFIAKINMDFKAYWMKSTNNITLDQTPEVEIVDNHVAFLSNIYAGNNNKLELQYFELDGNWIDSDSITKIGATSHNNIGLSSAKDNLYMLYSPFRGNTFYIRKIKINGKDTILTKISSLNHQHQPKILEGNNSVYLTSSFHSKTAIIHGDTLKNPNGSASPLLFRQMIAKYEFDCVVDTSVTQNGAILTANTNTGTYQWLDCDNSMKIIPREIAKSFKPNINGNYAVEITQNGCKDTSACYNISTVGLRNVLNGVGVKFYPNPSTGKVNLEFGQELKEATIVVKNNLGQEVAKIGLGQRLSIELELEGPSGMYFLEIMTTQGVLGTLKVVKE